MQKSASFFFIKRCPTLGISPVLWVRLSSHTQTNPD